MRIVPFVFGFLLSLIAAPAPAAERTEEQCDRLIEEAFSMLRKDREAGLIRLNSKAVGECLKKFSVLDAKYFPPSDSLPGPAINHNPVFSVAPKPAPLYDPAFPFRPR